MQLATALGFGQAGYQNKRHNFAREPAVLVRNLYDEVVIRRPLGIPDDADLKVFAPYLSKLLLRRLDLSAACESDWERQHPDPHLKSEIGWQELGIFSGDNEEASPREFHVGGVQSERNGTYRVDVKLTGEDSPRLSWRIAVIVVRETGHLVVDDVFYLDDDGARNANARLSRCLSIGCNGPRWVGYGKRRKSFEKSGTDGSGANFSVRR